MTAARFREIEGAFNVREIGGYETREGRRTRPNVLFRSSALHRLAGAQALGARTVVDLRGPADVERDSLRLGPVLGHAGVRRVPIPLIPASSGRQTTSEFLDARYGPGISAGRYRGYLEVGSANLRRVIATLGEPGAFPALVHCTGGKDRTGVVVALVLDVLGVSRATIIEDYALTNVALDALARELRRAPDAASLSESDLALFRAPPEAMAGFLDWLHAEHGSARRYLGSIGVPDAAFAGLERALLG